MTVSAKDLRFKISMLFDVLTKGEEVTITYRGKPKARLISYEDGQKNEKSDALFGLWKEQKDNVEEYVRAMRRGRQFDL